MPFRNREHCGIAYVSVGESYVRETATSIASLLRVHPDAVIDVLSCGPDLDRYRAFLPEGDNVRIVDCSDHVAAMGINAGDNHEVSRALKVSVVNLSRFETTIFLDSDTYVRQSLDEIAGAPDAGQIDLVVTNEPYASHSSGNVEGRPVAVQLFRLSNPSVFNSGVFAFSRRLKDCGFGDAWIRTWKSQINAESAHEWGRLSDQRALNRAIKEEKPRLKIFPNVLWNAQCKILYELYKQGRWDDIRIIHCKMVHRLGPQPEKLVQNDYIRRFELAGAF